MNKTSVRLASTLLGLLCLLSSSSLIQTQAYGTYGYGPHSYKNHPNYGEGIYYAPHDTKIYAEPSEEAKLVEELTWSAKATSNSIFSKVRNANLNATSAFISYYPAQETAMMALLTENGEGWAEVVYDQAHAKTGWVKLAPESAATETALGQFQTWMDFMRFNAKPNGVYWLDGVSEYNRSLRSAPEDTAKLIPVTYMREMKVRHIRGNWMLVEIWDFDRSSPIGWLRWRDDEGNLMVFAKLQGGTQPALTSSY